MNWFRAIMVMHVAAFAALTPALPSHPTLREVCGREGPGFLGEVRGFQQRGLGVFLFRVRGSGFKVQGFWVQGFVVCPRVWCVTRGQGTT